MNTQMTRRSLACLLAAVSALPMAGCSALPSDGPSASRVLDGAGPAAAGGPPPYVLVDVDERIARAASAGHVAEGLAEDLPRGRGVGGMGPGDLVKVTLWEPNPSGQTMIDRPGTEVAARVGTDGTVTVPFAGRLRVSGRTPAQVEDSIRSSLKTQGHEMQVSVLDVEDVTNAVFVQGDVARPGRYPVVPGGRGLLDLVALAGGAKGQNQATDVRVTRGQRTWQGSLGRLLADPGRNMELSPGDRVLLLPSASRHFFAFGSVEHPGEQAVETDDMSLARTLARVSGLNPARADAEGVFVYRRQDAAETRRLTGGTVRADQDPTQVVYRVNLRSPQGLFVAQAFQIQPGDILYVSESPVSEAGKFLQIITGFVNLTSSARPGI